MGVLKMGFNLKKHEAKQGGAPGNNSFTFILIRSLAEIRNNC